MFLFFLDSSGTPYIFHHHNEWDYSYSKWTGSEWTTEELGSGVQSFILDTNGNPHITIYDSDETLMYVSVVPLPMPTPTPEPTPTPTPMPSSTPVSKPTPAPEATHSSSPTPTQTPTTGVPTEILITVVAVAVIAATAAVPIVYIKRQEK